MSTERPTIYQPARYHDLDKDNVTVAQCSEQCYNLTKKSTLQRTVPKENKYTLYGSISKDRKDLKSAVTLLSSIVHKSRSGISKEVL